ncbi:MAG: hypothetical protein LVQ96_07170 [Thermoplasmatales archaeon]|nr:hypothetical protein [Thermoplasmatales archaeon]MCW6170936.1 hypothetical protein [Thermoplasmatales archaeon]
MIPDLQYLPLVIFGLSAIFSLINKKIAYLLIVTGSIIFGYLQFQPGNEITYFSLIVSIVWIIVGIYSLSYGESYGKWLPSLLSVTILGMFVILTANNYVLLIVGWEVMSIPSYLIIALNKRDSPAAFTFMVFSELSTIFLIAGILYAFSLSGFTTFAFASLHSAIPLILIGFGALIKMGMTPFLISEWLPIAHGSAPASASAIFSATMTVMGVYIIFRLVEISVGSPGLYYVGLIFLVIGGISIFFASIYAYISENMKMLGGFSTIENQAAILSAFGLFLISSDALLKQFVLVTIIIFTFSHSLSKTGLFLAVGNSSGEYFSQVRTKNNIFGRAGTMLSIISLSGLFPTIGGLAVWMLLESFFMQAFIGGYTGIVAIISGSIIAVSEGMVTGAMLKIFFFTNLFRRQVGNPEKLQSFVVFFVGLAVVALFALSVLIVPQLFLSGIPSVLVFKGLMIESRFGAGDFGLISPDYVILLISVFSLVAYAIFRGPETRIAPAWNGGSPVSPPYTSFAYSGNIKIMLKKILRTKTDTYGHNLSVVDVFWSSMIVVGINYRRACRLITRGFMNSSVGWYMVYMIVAFMVVLLISVLFF